MKISLCARSQILQLKNRSSIYRVLISEFIPGANVDLIPIEGLAASDVTICIVPLVVIDTNAEKELGKQSIDFDYNTSRFTISNRGAY